MTQRRSRRVRFELIDPQGYKHGPFPRMADLRDYIGVYFRDQEQDADLIEDALGSLAPAAPASALLELFKERGLVVVSMSDLLACGVSCSGLDITIQCSDHDTKDRLMDALTGDQP